MEKSKVRSWNHLGLLFAALLTTLGLATSCGGSSVSIGATTTSGSPTPPSTPTQPSIGSIASAVATAVNAQYIAGNAVQYYCDCQTGAATNCVAGSDSSAGTLPSNPRKTIDAAMTWLNGGANRTVALCQGGAFIPAATTGNTIYTLSTNSCPAGSICNELREYPFQGTGAKPIITSPVAHTLFGSNQNTSNGGWRFMNLKLQGTWDPSSAHASWAFFLYTNSTNFVHDVTVANVDIDSFDVGFDDANNANNNVTLTANHISNSSQWGYLGGSKNLNISYNSFVNNGSGNTFLHSIYLSSNNNTASNPLSNVSIIGNFVSGFSTAGGATQCVGEPIVGHAAVTNLIVSGNVVIEGSTANPQCYGISFSNGNNYVAYYRNALFSNNIVVNGGNAGIAIDNCPYCVIENNLVIQEANNGGIGIASPTGPSRTQDDKGTNERIVNNTIYFGVNNTQGMGGGVKVAAEGTGHIIANNTIMYAATSHGTQSISCLNVPLPLTSYAFINNNNCFSNDSAGKWASDATTFYSLPSWLLHTASVGFDTASSPANPGWSFATPMTVPVLNEAQTGAQIFMAFFKPVGLPLVGTGDAANAPVTDIANTTRPTPPSIGAYE